MAVLLSCASAIGTMHRPCTARPASAQTETGSTTAVGAEPGQERYAALSRAKRWGELADLAQAALGKDAHDTDALYWQGVAHFELDDTLGALRALRGAQKLGCDTADLHIQLGQVYYRLNQFVLFEREMQVASKLDPLNGTPKYLLGFYRIAIKSDLSGALADLSEAARLQPNDPKVLYQLGYDLEMSGRSTEAKEHYKRAIVEVKAGKQSFAWPFQGMARLVLNEDPQAALQFARDAVLMTPGEPTNHLVLAKVYERLGDSAKAISEAQLAARGRPTDASTRYLLFRLYQRGGEKELASQELTMFDKINAIYGPE